MRPYLLIFATAACVLLKLASAAPIISEFMASNSATIVDEDGEYSDWIEIHNPDATPVDMAGWHLTDDASALTKWTFPAVTIPADGYLLVFATNKNRGGAGSELHSNFKLSSGGEYLALVKPDGTTPTTEFNEYPAQITDYSYGLPQQTQVTETVVDEGAGLRYRVPSAAIADWKTLAYDDTGTAWSNATSGIGYDRGSGYDSYISTDIESKVYGVNNSIYLRFHFNVAAAGAVNAMTLLTKCDDGFVAYLNGEFLASQNAPGAPAWNSAALSSVEAKLASFDNWNVDGKIAHLVTGANVLAIQLLNQATNSSDLLMIPKLEIVRDAETTPGTYTYFVQPTPGSINNTPAGLPSGDVTISVPSGIKTAAISVTLASAEPSAEIRYTLDGSEPGKTSQLYAAPLSISDPAQLRARSYEPGKSASRVAVADYGFFEASLLSYAADVPVIVMDNFGAGAYPNKGSTPDGSHVQQVPWQGNVMNLYDVSGNGQPFSQNPSIQSRTGCRVRGSSSSSFPRKSLSVEFWDDNDSDNDSITPFGMPAEADWALYAPYQNYDRSLLHNQVSFEFARLIGATAPDSKVVVVFQNTNGGKVGLDDLAGVYILMEKIERNRIGLDFDEMSADGNSGGWMLEVDRLGSIPVGMPANTVQPNFHCAGPNGILEIPDDVESSSGSQPDDISNFYHSYLTFSEPDGYDILPAQRNQVQTQTRAMDTMMWSPGFGNQETGYPAFIDVDSWARFYMVQNFASNNDAIVLSTYMLKRSPASKIEMGPVWDFDRAYTSRGSAASNPLWASNRDWYAALFKDSNFKQTHQDAWQEARRTVISDSVLQGLVDSAAAGLKADQIAASGVSFSNWQTEVSDMKTWMVARARYLDSQYEAMPTISPQTREFVGNVSVSMAATAGGTVYYTTDGTDPRAWGGGISASAQIYTGALSFTERTHVTLRTRDGGRWSGKIEQDYFKISGLPQLVISEIAYHPADPTASESALGFTDSDEFEYLEIMNIGPSAVDLGTLVLGGGVTFEFSAAAFNSLPPGGRALVVANQAAFEARHGTSLPVVGVFQGNLKNSSSQILLKDAVLDIEFQNFAYDDGEPWPTQADGDGYSLILKQPVTNPDHSIATNWRGSSSPSGSPGASDARASFVGTPTDDDDFDGVPALLEHFFGTSDQNSGSGQGQYRMGEFILPDDGLNYPTLAVDYRIGADDVSASVEWSESLLSWDASSASILLVSDIPNGDGTSTMIWRSTQPFSTIPQFFRVKAILSN